MLPDYKTIYTDIIRKKCPERIEEFIMFLSKPSLSGLDVIKLNNKIFGTADRESQRINQKHRSYSKSDILKILSYQKKNHLNNTQLSIHFKLSRNTVAKWRKMHSK